MFSCPDRVTSLLSIYAHGAKLVHLERQTMFAAAQLGGSRWRAFRTIVAGLLLAAAGVLLIIAAHSGHFG